MDGNEKPEPGSSKEKGKILNLKKPKKHFGFSFPKVSKELQIYCKSPLFSFVLYIIQIIKPNVI
jgi:hypothetical protein